MLSQVKVEAGSKTEFPRVIGNYGGHSPGPLVVGIGGVHGNEPAGALALRRVLRTLEEIAPPFKGEFVALAGNRYGLYRQERYLNLDLNRMWKPERVRELKGRSKDDDLWCEETEQRELLESIESALAKRQGEAIFLDLHTTSSDGAPFAIISDTLVNRHFAEQFRVPIILGLEENLDGTILNYINELGHAAIGFEAGQSQSPDSIGNHEAAIWATLVTAGCIKPAEVPDLALLRQSLKRAARGLPQFLELRYRHAISEEDEFVMAPGFANFQPVEKGQLLAHDFRGEVRAVESGYLFMPLYQKLGDDGFFLIRRVNPFWLKLSAWLRRLRFDRLLPLLPGVQHIPREPDSLLINTRLAHWFALEICHLLGFRKHSWKDGKLIVNRRRQSRQE